MNYKNLRNGFFALLLASTTFVACDKDDDGTPSTGNAKVNMHLTDGPADYDAIYLDIQEVEIKMGDNSPATFVPFRPGLYDILRFRNGLDTLLLTATVPVGTVSQIRLILGNNNSIVVDGVSHPLQTPSGQTSGVKLNLHETFVAGGAYDIWLDFDASKSILQTGNGDYKLKPVIRAFSSLTNGIIEGVVIPLAALPVVYAINGVDTFAAIPDPNHANFQIRGLPSGTYNVLIDAENPAYTDLWINNVNVTYGQVNDIGQIILQ